MNKSILYLGGMCGDIILKMTDPSSLKPDKTAIGDGIKKSRTVMKKFWKFNDRQKDWYYNRVNSIPFVYYTLTHDTDYCLNNPTDVIQLFSSNADQTKWISARFKHIHETAGLHKVIDRVAEQQNFDVKDFVNNYAKLVNTWQQAFIFENRFDISKIGSAEFLDQVCGYFEISDYNWARHIYTRWCIENNFNNSLL